MDYFFFFFLALPCKNIIHLVVVTECSMALRHDPILHFPFFFVSFLFSFDLKCFQFLFFWVESTWRSGGLSIRVHVQTFDVPIATERRGGYTICRLSAISHYNDSI